MKKKFDLAHRLCPCFEHNMYAQTYTLTLYTLFIHNTDSFGTIELYCYSIEFAVK